MHFKCAPTALNSSQRIQQIIALDAPSRLVSVDAPNDYVVTHYVNQLFVTVASTFFSQTSFSQ